MIKKKKIVVTGGTGRFGEVLKKTKLNYSLFFPSKNELDITKFNSIKKYLKKIKPFCLIHLAGLSRPMQIHEKKISNVSKNLLTRQTVEFFCTAGVNTSMS